MDLASGGGSGLDRAAPFYGWLHLHIVALVSAHPYPKIRSVMPTSRSRLGLGLGVEGNG